MQGVACEEAILRATTPGVGAADTTCVEHIKKICKRSEESTSAVYSLLLSRLEEPDSRVRLLALDICAKLFQKSLIFRAMLVDRFPKFLELTVGYRQANPLPPPSDSAGQLRSHALELVQQWQTMYGQRYRQLRLAASYLKNTLQYRMPQIAQSSSLDQEEHANREARSQQILRKQFEDLRESWQDLVADIKSLLLQFEEAFDLWEESLRHLQSDSATVDETLRWCDCDVNLDSSQCHIATGIMSEEEEGLTNYEVISTPDDDDRPSIKHMATLNANSVLQGDVATNQPVDPAIVESLGDLYRLMTSRAMPTIQNALHIAVKIETNDSSLEAEKIRVLREATVVRTDLMAACEKYRLSGLQVGTHLSGSTGHSCPQDACSRDQRHGYFSNVEESALEFLKSSEVGTKATYWIRDPAAPEFRWEMKREDNQSPAAFPAASRGREAVLTERETKDRGSEYALSEDTRKRLVARAPVLPAGPYVRVWDTDGNGPLFMSNHGMELSNHWGPVDVHTQMPKDREEELFLLHWDDRGKGLKTKSETRRDLHAFRTAGPSRRTGTSGGGVTQGKELLLRHQSDSSSNKFSQRQMERLYNDAVISSNAVQQDSMPHQCGQSKASMSKRNGKSNPVAPRERLRRKLLSGKALAKTRNDIDGTEVERWRDSFGVKSW